jgi:hypothetical protein
LNVTEKSFVPATRAAVDGRVACESLEVIATVCVTDETRFQFASTAFTVTVVALPAVCAVGVPVLPVALPGSAVSPGSSTCSFVAVPAFTVTDADVPAVRGDPFWSVAVTVHEPAVLNVRLKSFVPPTNAAFDGRVACESLELIATVCVTEDTRFQFASTAFTVTVVALPAVCAVGEPVLPVTVPASALSPGRSTCSFEAAPGLTVIEAVASEVANVSPDVADAVSVMFSAFVYWTVVRFTEQSLAAIVPVLFDSVPGEPPPSRELIANAIPVFCVTGAQLPCASCDSTTIVPKFDPAVALPGYDVIASFVAAPGPTDTDDDVPAVNGAMSSSVAVTVHEPVVFNVTENVCVPPTRSASPGNDAFESLDVIDTVCVTDDTRFQFASTAFTVTSNDDPAV